MCVKDHQSYSQFQWYMYMYMYDRLYVHALGVATVHALLRMFQHVQNHWGPNTDSSYMYVCEMTVATSHTLRCKTHDH